jgi:hypothetical protein
MPVINLPDEVADINVKTYFKSMDHAYQQGKPKLLQYVTQGGSFIGDKAYFPRMEPVVAQNLQRLTEVSLQNGVHEMIEVGCPARIAAMPVADVDKNKLSVSLATEYGVATNRAMQRDVDKTIYDAMLAAANAAGSTVKTIGNYNNDLTFTHLLEAMAYLDDQEALEDEVAAIVMPATPRALLAGNLNLGLAQAPGLSKASIRFLDPLDDVDVVTFKNCSSVTAAPAGDPALTAGVVGTDVFVWVRSAVCAAMNDDLKAVNERLGSYLTDMIGAWQQKGACVRHKNGIVRIKCRRNSPIVITPVSTKEAA